MAAPTARTARELFADLASRRDADLGAGELELGAVLIAAEEYPDLDPAAVLGALDRLGERAGDRIASEREGAARVERLNRFLFDEEGFAGASEYYDPRNSYLNEVLARRCGIPITLALVYMGVARRAGIDARGISFPGHFLVRCAGREGQIVDAFHGRTITLGDCEARLATALGPGIELRPEVHLRDASAREILVRMLTNLQRIFGSRGDSERLLACCDRILLLTPTDPVALRDRAVMYQRLGWFAAAIADLEAALERASDAGMTGALARLRDALRARLGRPH
ncbi:MAG TPA: transglutaminase-like domain-containing protein [Myxococcota bacterium]|nr:transglutaminase-like domain-containing protein [Myxococcota bacterium]